MVRLLEGFDLDFCLVAMPYNLIDQETLDDLFHVLSRFMFDFHAL